MSVDYGKGYEQQEAGGHADGCDPLAYHCNFPVSFSLGLHCFEAFLPFRAIRAV